MSAGGGAGGEGGGGMFQAGGRTPALHQRWRWTVAGCLHGSPVSSEVRNRGGPKGRKKRGQSHRQCARPSVGAGWGLGRGSEESRTGHLPDGAESQAPSSFRCCPRARTRGGPDLVASPGSPSNAKKIQFHGQKLLRDDLSTSSKRTPFDTGREPPTRSLQLTELSWHVGDPEPKNLTFVSGRLYPWRTRVNSSPCEVIGREDITTERLAHSSLQAAGAIACSA